MEMSFTVRDFSHGHGHAYRTGLLSKACVYKARIHRHILADQVRYYGTYTAPRPFPAARLRAGTYRERPGAGWRDLWRHVLAMFPGLAGCHMPGSEAWPPRLGIKLSVRHELSFLLQNYHESTYLTSDFLSGPCFRAGAMKRSRRPLRRTAGPSHGRPQGRHAACPSRLSCACTAPPRGAFAGHGYEVLEASGE